MNIFEDSDFDYSEEEKDLCDYIQSDCVNKHDCVNCWFYHDVIASDEEKGAET